jgi:preprotein translocase subunit SecG
MAYYISLVLQFVLAFAVIFLVLIHSGKGGGLSDMFGGGLGAQAAGSTVMEKNLDRITVVVALVFGFNTVILALLMDR